MIRLALTIPSINDVITEFHNNPIEFRETIQNNPSLLNIVMQEEGKNSVKYVRITENDQKKLLEAKKRGVAEGVLIGFAVALFFKILDEFMEETKK